MTITNTIREALDRAFSPECDMSAPLTHFERACAGLALLAPLLGVALVGALVGGCSAFYSNSGSSTVVGEQMILPEITDSSDNIAVRIYEDIQGARVWTARDSKVTIKYANSYTNTYFGIAHTQGDMRLAVDIEPLYVGEDCETNAVPSCSSSDSSASTPSTPSPTASSTASPSGE